VKHETTVKSLEKSEISNAPDGTNNDVVFEES